MLRWIAKLFGFRSMEKTCVKTLAQDELLVRLYKGRRKRGKEVYFAELFLHVGEKSEWMKIGALAAVDIPAAIQLLSGASQYVDAIGTRKFVAEIVGED
jgi:hypothetical protein